MVVEGINAIPAAVRLKKEYNVDMPIIDAVDAVINKGELPKDVIKSLMIREKKNEIKDFLGFDA